MAEFRKFAPDQQQVRQTGQWQADPVLLRALSQSLQPWLKQAQAEGQPKLAVALSGGADSAMLAVHTHVWASQHDVELHYFHIHHGLQAAADGWQQHVHALAQRLRRPCHSLRVQVDGSRFRADGMESAARQARYAGLATLAQQCQLSTLLLAHHQDDQAETVLMRLLRGAGPDGLGAMQSCVQRQNMFFLRPWLAVSRRQILQAADDFAQHTDWHAVQDPTNINPDYTRGAVRDRLTPILNERWAGWQGVLARQARLSQEQSRILQEVAAQDWLGLEPDEQGGFSLAAWRLLSPERQALVLRYWLDRQGQAMPTEARLSDLMRQLRGLHALGHDRHLQVKHAQVWIMCRRGRVFLQAITTANT